MTFVVSNNLSEGVFTTTRIRKLVSLSASVTNKEPESSWVSSDKDDFNGWAFVDEGVVINKQNKEAITKANYGASGVDDYLDSMFNCQFNSVDGDTKVDLCPTRQ